MDLFLYKVLLLVDKKALKFKYNDYFVLLKSAKHTDKYTYKYGLLSKCEVTMAGYILAKFFFCVLHKLAKKERGQYPDILTEQAWSIKDLLYGF